MHDYDKAIDDFTTMIRLDPTNVEGYLRRAYAWSQKPDVNKAVADLSEAIRLDPKNAYAFYGRSQCCAKKGKRPSPRSDFEMHQA